MIDIGWWRRFAEITYFSPKKIRVFGGHSGYYKTPVTGTLQNHLSYKSALSLSLFVSVSRSLCAHLCVFVRVSMWELGARYSSSRRESFEDFSAGGIDVRLWMDIYWWWYILMNISCFHFYEAATLSVTSLPQLNEVWRCPWYESWWQYCRTESMSHGSVLMYMCWLL